MNSEAAMNNGVSQTIKMHTLHRVTLCLGSKSAQVQSLHGVTLCLYSNTAENASECFWRVFMYKQMDVRTDRRTDGQTYGVTSSPQIHNKVFKDKFGILFFQLKVFSFYKNVNQILKFVI